MTFKIDRIPVKGISVVLRTCGRMDIECVNTLKDLMSVLLTFLTPPDFGTNPARQVGQ